MTVPAFSNSKTCVLLNLRTLMCQPVKFSAALSSEQDNPSFEQEMDM